MSEVIAALLGYLLGSIPFGLLLTKLAGLGDIRSIGSGNIGATNVLRTGRKDLALATLLLDGGKGAVAVLIARLISESRRVRLFAGLAARRPALARLLRPLFELAFRRSQICLGHNQFLRLDVLQSLGGFPTSGATEE